MEGLIVHADRAQVRDCKFRQEMRDKGHDKSLGKCIARFDRGLTKLVSTGSCHVLYE